MSWFTLGLIGGAVGLDSTSFPQMMISRPLVAATLTGLVLGRPLDGLAVGLLLEVFSLVILPIGAVRHPEAGTGAVAASAAYIHVTTVSAAFPLFLAVVFGLFWERVAGSSVNWLRRSNVRLVSRQTVPSVARPGRDLETRHLLAIAVDFVRGCTIVLTGTFLAIALFRLVIPRWQLEATLALGALLVASAVMLGASLSVFGGWRKRRLSLLLGILCGCVLMGLRWLG